jgi:hypothetical protein
MTNKMDKNIDILKQMPLNIGISLKTMNVLYVKNIHT